LTLWLLASTGEYSQFSSLTYQETLIYFDAMNQTVLTRTEEATRLFHALSDPTRLQILEQLKTGEQCVCELMEVFHTGQSRLSFHLRVLREAGLISDRPDGRWIYYSLNPKGLKEVAVFVGELQDSRASRRSPDRCE
jgi:ArsR family transcriptional regulator